MNQPFDIEAFRWRLAETITWCSAKAKSAVDYPQYNNPRIAFRKYVLRPPSLQHMVFDSEKRESSMWTRSGDEVKGIVEALAKQRALLLQRDRHRPKYPTEAAIDLAGGRLMRYSPFENLADGAAEQESDGFFDTENEPPWDTWVDAMTLPHHNSSGEADTKFCEIVCWVPKEFIGVAERGISVNPEVCIEWLDQSWVALFQPLRHAGFC